MKYNPYYLKARLFPTALTSIPALLLYNKFVAPLYHDKLENIYSVLPTITDVILSSAIVFLFVQINRFVSKEVFQRLYFTDELKMPTTNQLLLSDEELESSIKTKLRNKIKIKYDIDLLPLSDEVSQEQRARKIIVSSVSQIRNSLRENKLLLQHNIEYGFFRNLIGGSFIAVIISAIIICFSYWNNDLQTKNLGILLCVLYFIPIVLSKLIINRYGKYYAKILFEQFLTI